MDNILTVDEVAALLKVKPITVREMLREQRIRGFKVGKAWRTTETMLEEDLATIARGAKPEPLEAQVALAALPKRVRGPRKTAKAAAPPAPKPTAKAAERPAAPEETETPAAKPSKRKGKATDAKKEDQQLLF